MSTVAIPLAPGATVRRRRAAKRVLGVALGTILVGALAGSEAAGGHAITTVGLVALLLPIVVWFRPQLGPIVLLMTGLLVEQFQLGLSNSNGAVMNVPITNSIPMFKGLGSLHLQPADLLPMIVFAIYMARSSGAGIRWWPRTQLSLAVVTLVGCVLIFEAYGLSQGGDWRESLFECRPYIYLGACYLLTSVVIRTRSAVHAVLWAIVISETIKSLQGIYVWFRTMHWTPKPQNVLGHEEAMFFSLYFFMVAALWMFDQPGRLRTVATRVVPLVLFADIVNDRRAAWLMLGAGFIVLGAVGYRVLPDRRRKIGRVAVISGMVLALYLPAFWNHTDGTLGKPADAIRSAIAPNPRDALSDEYRVDEDANLKYNIKMDGVLGAGFGRMIDYALPMPGLVTAGDAGITYVPHNSVLYILMRMGLLGGTAFWAMLGAGIIAGCRLARCPDKKLAAVGAVVAAALVAWALEGGTDMGFTFPRVAIVIGCLLGLVEAARHIQTTSSAPSPNVG